MLGNNNNNNDCYSMSPTSPLETNNNNTHKFRIPIGLGLVDVLRNDTESNKKSFLLGSHVKIQLPPISQCNSMPSSPQSPTDEFGDKTATLSSSFSPRLLTEMEMSDEDYTCVISHEPNPKTTHIFDNCCIVESCGDCFVALREANGLSSDHRLGYSLDGFLSCCHACKKNLSQGSDIFMYRGEKAFCSEECRSREILLEEQYGKNFSEDLPAHLL